VILIKKETPCLQQCFKSLKLARVANWGLTSFDHFIIQLQELVQENIGPFFELKLNEKKFAFWKTYVKERCFWNTDEIDWTSS